MEVSYMDETNHGLALHKSIMCNNFQEFFDFLQMSNFGINKQNENGETPLLVCLKLWISSEFSKCLLLVGASMTIPDKEDITPLGFVVAHNCWGALQSLLEHCSDTEFMYEAKLSYTLHAALKRGKCQFKTLVINSVLDGEKVLVCISTSDPSYSGNTAIKEINVFSNLVEADKHLDKSVLNYICITLIKQSISLNTATAFKTIWKKDRLHFKFAYMQPRFLLKFLMHCNFRDVEFIECLRLILVSKHVRYFIQMPSYTTIYEVLLRRFYVRNIDKQGRIFIISRTVQLAKVTIKDVLTAYRFFGFNEEVVILLQYFNSKELFQGDFSVVLNFIVHRLEVNPKLKIENLNKLGLVAAASYRKLLNSVPEDLFGNNKIIKEKKRVLNQVPTLVALSTHASQICLRNFYHVRDVNQFNTIVGNLYLPRAIKDSLCHEPPIYYG